METLLHFALFCGLIGVPAVLLGAAMLRYLDGPPGSRFDPDVPWQWDSESVSPLRERSAQRAFTVPASLTVVRKGSATSRYSQW